MPQVSLDAEDIRNEKVKVLRSMKVVSPDDVVLGQYKARGKQPGYLDDPTVPKGRWVGDRAAASGVFQGVILYPKPYPKTLCQLCLRPRVNG